jgi:hypothetical protein
MPQFMLPFKYEEETKTSGLTSLAGLPLYLELLYKLNIVNIMRNIFDVDTHESTVWKASEIVLTLVLLNLAGGEHVEDLRILKEDGGFRILLDKIRMFGMTSSQRRAFRRNQKQQGSGIFPSCSTVFRFLKQDGDEDLASRGQGKAYIPQCSRTIQQLRDCNQALIACLENNLTCETITLDIDATLIETHKSDSLYSYKGFTAYQPLNVWWDEQMVMLHTQFRDGNVPAGYALKPVLEEALSLLPKNTGKSGVFLRSDTAAYEIDFLKFCEDKNIQFAIGCPISQSLRETIKSIPDSAWRRLDKLREYAEVCFVPSSLSTSKKGYEFRYVATREALQEQRVLPGTPPKEYPFPVATIGKNRYKIHAIVTNRDVLAPDLVAWYHKRCGHSEEVHAILKNDLAGGTLPCNHFHANAVWWWITVISHNINSIFKYLCCDKSLHCSQIKHIRFCIICKAGRIVERGRQLFIRLNSGYGIYELFHNISLSISRLRPCHG